MNILYNTNKTIFIYKLNLFFNNKFRLYFYFLINLKILINLIFPNQLQFYLNVNFNFYFYIYIKKKSIL